MHQTGEENHGHGESLAVLAAVLLMGVNATMAAGLPATVASIPAAAGSVIRICLTGGGADRR